PVFVDKSVQSLRDEPGALSAHRHPVDPEPIRNLHIGQTFRAGRHHAISAARESDHRRTSSRIENWRSTSPTSNASCPPNSPRSSRTGTSWHYSRVSTGRSTLLSCSGPLTQTPVMVYGPPTAYPDFTADAGFGEPRHFLRIPRALDAD
ncbi:MAG TPA: hypothetical protein VJT49_04010, partial [Amycolatopsis sp.]|uniref:hypothetical protein n=1 Tax=Amycolatopsis sp. TaxID=37632 RepID=UPI002B47150F